MASNETDSKLEPISEVLTATSSSANAAGFDVMTSSDISNNNDLAEKISQILKLEDNEEKDQIIYDLLTNGLQALAKYQKVLIPEIYSAAMNTTDDHSDDKPTLLKLLKQNVYARWKTVCESQPTIREFINKVKDKNNDHFETVLRHTAEYGIKYTKTYSMLAIVLPLLFDGIDDNCLKNESVFTELFNTVTREGKKGCHHFEQYISPDDLKEQINDPASPLFLALRMYYSEKVSELFQQYKIQDTKPSLYALAIDNMMENGWLAGIESVKGKIPPVKYQPLFQAIQNIIGLPQKHELPISNSTSTTTKPISSTTTVVETIPMDTNLAVEKDQVMEQITSNTSQSNNPVPSNNNSVASLIEKEPRISYPVMTGDTPVQADSGLLTAAFSAIMGIPLSTNGSNSDQVEKVSVFDHHKTTYSYGPVGDAAATSRANNRCFLLIKMLNHPIIECDVKQNAKIEEIRACVHELKGVLPSKQRLIYNGKQLEDGKTMLNYNMTSGDTIHLVATSHATKPVILDFTSLDPVHNYDFTNIKDVNETFIRGNEKYIRPCGFKRFALNVSGKYENMRWIGCDNGQGEWPVSYHGTGDYKNKTIAQSGNASTQGKRVTFTHGVYSTPDPHLAEKYAKKFIYNNEQYIVVFQNRVNRANSIKCQAEAETEDYWVSPSEEDVRPYGICIRKI